MSQVEWLALAGASTGIAKADDQPSPGNGYFMGKRMVASSVPTIVFPVKPPSSTALR